MKSSTPKRRLVLPIVVAMFLAACESGPSTAQQEPHSDYHKATGDLQETTVSLTELPRFLDNQTETVRVAYLAAARSADLLQWIPCYCGCGESAGHQSNLSCFIRELKADGTVIWDDHGTRCGVCLEIAIRSVQLKMDGKSDLEIRNIIDETYQESYAVPTPTPMPG